MAYKLGTNVEVGNKILLKAGWAKITDVEDEGVKVFIKFKLLSDFIEYDSVIYGWKIK